MEKQERRDFLKYTAVAGLGSFYLGASKGTAGPNETVRHAVIGTGGQGQQHCREFNRFSDCEVVAIADVDPKRRENAHKELGFSPRVDLREDFRRILDDPAIDSVSIATPDHWHAPVALAALSAGKHVYVEKPCCHNVQEGVLLAEAARKTRKCVQHGTQSRSGRDLISVMDQLHSGLIGKVRMAKAVNHQFRKPIGRKPDSEPPDGVNYDLWLGPAPVRPFSENRWHYNWHWYWDYGTGDIGNDGVHQIDAARWGLGVGLPHAISASGGQLFYDDDHETPDTQVVVYEYEDCFLMYEMRLWTDYQLENHVNGNVFYGDKGKLDVGPAGCILTYIDEEPRKIGGWRNIETHMRNFLDCVKADDPEKLTAPIQDTYISACLCHLGNISTRVGRQIEFDPKTHTIPNDEEASSLLSREYRKGYELPAVV